MGVFDGFEDEVLSIYKVGSSLIHDESGHLHINDNYLTTYIKSIFLQSQGFQLATQHCLTRGGGFHSCC